MSEITKDSLAIITDSAADLTDEMIAHYAIDVVDLSVTVGGETFFGNHGIESQELLKRMEENHELPKTSMPSVGAFKAAYERALEKAEKVLSIHISPSLSGTYNAALMAAKDFAGRVEVFDSRTLSMSQGFQALEAARLYKEGLKLPEILEHIKVIRNTVHQLAGFDSLEYLVKGGRIGRASSLMGAMLNLKPSIEVNENGEFIACMKSRGNKGAVKDTVKWIRDRIGNHMRGVFAVGFAFNRDRAESLADAIRENFEPVGGVLIYEAGPVISTHTGPGWGVAFYPCA